MTENSELLCLYSSNLALATAIKFWSFLNSSADSVCSLPALLFRSPKHPFTSSPEICPNNYDKALEGYCGDSSAHHLHEFQSNVSVKEKVFDGALEAGFGQFPGPLEALFDSVVAPLLRMVKLGRNGWGGTLAGFKKRAVEARTARHWSLFLRSLPAYWQVLPMSPSKFSSPRLEIRLKAPIK